MLRYLTNNFKDNELDGADPSLVEASSDLVAHFNRLQQIKQLTADSSVYSQYFSKDRMAAPRTFMSMIRDSLRGLNHQ